MSNVMCLVLTLGVTLNKTDSVIFVRGMVASSLKPQSGFESRLEGGVNRANMKFINLSTTTSRG
jgi:hypothetical protein